MRCIVRSIVLFLVLSFSILVYYLWTSKYIETSQIFGSPYHVDNYSFLAFFGWEPINVPIVHVSLPSDFDPRWFPNVLYFRVPSPLDCSTSKVDDISLVEMDGCHNMDEVRMQQWGSSAIQQPSLFFRHSPVCRPPPLV